MNNLYEALEICLQEIEQGAEIDGVLIRYPDLAGELRPILESALQAKKMAIPAPPADLVRRNRARVLQRAAEMREAEVKSSARRFWSASLRRTLVTLAVVVALFVSGTGLVRAASNTLPGDNLYPVKRTWEDVRVLLTFNPQQRQTLEVEHETERLYELRELFMEGRSAEVDFAGLLTSQNGNEWLVSSIPVLVSPQTEIRDPGIGLGSAVRVKGLTEANGAVRAERIELLPAGATVPEVNDEPESQQGPNQVNEDNSGKGSGEESPTLEDSKTPESESQLHGGSEKSGSDSGGSSGSSEDGSSHKGGSDSGGHNSGSGSGGGGDD